jgi:heavy metal sensor kinase
MKSIRLSMTVYFLGLLAVALGVASWVVYQTAERTLQEKQAAAANLIESQYQERCHEEVTKLDNQLLAEAKTFPALIRFDNQQMTHPRILNAGNLVALLVAPTGPNAPAAALPVASIGLFPVSPGPGRPRGWERASAVYTPYYEEFFRRQREFHLTDDDVFDDPSRIADYFQLDGGRHGRHRSDSLARSSEWLSLDTSVFGHTQPDWRYDELTLQSGVTVRRVVLMTAFPTELPFSWGPPTVGPARGPQPVPTGDPQRPPLYVQCAYDVRIRDAALKVFADRRATELNALTAETNASLHTLRISLLRICAVTFTATVVGTWLLVWLGLRPLRRLSEAVSRVSEKDFRLQFNTRRLPAELRPIVDRLTNTLAQLKRAFAREKQATADISHELRTPLAALLTTTELALRKPRTAEEYREMLEDCRLSGQQMNRAVERLLALARLDAGVDTMRPERVDVSVLAEQCAALVRPLAEARGLRLRVHGGDGAQLLADPDKLREVITNLLHNAIEYNRPQGSIDVSVARQNGHLHVEVRDTGIGIKPEAKEHIFERFYRADSSRGGDDGLHAGLGLAIVKGYVDLMGGTIQVESAEGQGSTFHLQLPAGTT